MKIYILNLLLFTPCLAFSQLFKPLSKTSGFSHAFEFGVSKSTNSYRYNSLNLEMVNSYLWYSPNIELIGFELGAVTGIHYSDAMSTLNNYDGTKSVAQWEGVLVPLYLQIKVHLPFRSVYRFFMPHIGINAGHMFDISGNKVKNISPYREENDMGGILLGYFIGAELYSLKETKFYFQIGRFFKNNSSLSTGNDNAGYSYFVNHSLVSFMSLKIGIRFN